MKNKLMILTVTATTLVASFNLNLKSAEASFGDFMLGVGAAVGTRAIIDANKRNTQERYKPVSPRDEYYRGKQDGINNLRYDNPRNSSDYDRGYEEGARQRRR